jgi:phage gp36-like protein
VGNYLTFDSTTNDLKPYITEAAIENILTDVGVEADRQTTVNQAIDEAESEVDSYVGRRYTVPLTSPPPVVVGAAGWLTAEALYHRGHGPPDRVAERAAQIREWLVRIGKGEASLPDQDPVPTETTGAGVVTIVAEDRELERDDLGFW